jgi:hypothetical protein
MSDLEITRTATTAMSSNRKSLPTTHRSAVRFIPRDAAVVRDRRNHANPYNPAPKSKHNSRKHKHKHAVSGGYTIDIPGTTTEEAGTTVGPFATRNGMDMDWVMTEIPNAEQAIRSGISNLGPDDTHGSVVGDDEDDDDIDPDMPALIRPTTEDTTPVGESRASKRRFVLVSMRAWPFQLGRLMGDITPDLLMLDPWTSDTARRAVVLELVPDDRNPWIGKSHCNTFTFGH